MSKHELNLLDNAIDSLHESLVKYEQGENGDVKAYKFAILHISHFLELIFKYHLFNQDPLSIYISSSSKDSKKTISFWTAVELISKETGEIQKSSDFRVDLDWLKKLRNDIEHHKFEMNVDEVKDSLGRIFRSLLEFLELFSDLSLEDLIPENLLRSFKLLSNEYERRRQDAINEAQLREHNAYACVKPKYRGDVNFNRYTCPDCNSPTMIPDDDSSSGYRCLFCENEESCEIPVNCDACGVEYTTDEMNTWELDSGGIEYRCYYCSGQSAMDKDKT